jgi:thiol-disulfide isomerase/thioredoxin
MSGESMNPVEETEKEIEKNPENDSTLDFEKLFPDEIARNYAKTMIGKKAPDFELTDMKGDTIKLSELKGDNIILEVAQPNCPSCIDVYPVIESFKKDNPNTKVISIYLNSDEKDINNFFKKNKLTESDDIILIKNNYSISEAYQIKGTPTLLFIDKEGIIQYTHLGYAYRDQLDLMAILVFGEENVVIEEIYESINDEKTENTIKFIKKIETLN